MSRKATSLEEVMAAVYEEEGLTIDTILRKPDIIPSGSLALDYILGIGGWPRGRSIELSGLSQSGKTTCAAMAAVQAQRQGLPVVYIDFEQALDELYLQTLGVDVNNRKLFIPYPAGSLEQGMEAAHKAANTGNVGLLIFDSVAAMVPRKAVEAYNDNQTLAMNRARILGNTISALNPILARTNTCAIFINHIRDVIETSPVRPGMPARKTTPGGTSLKFYASIRCEFKVVKTSRHDRYDVLTNSMVSESHASHVEVKVTKNKLAAPGRTAQLYLEYGKGFVNAHTTMTLLVLHKIIRQSGAYYYFPDDLYHPQMTSGAKGASLQGLQTALDLAEMDEAWAARLLTRAQAVLTAQDSEIIEVTEAVPEVVAVESVPSPPTLQSVPDVPLASGTRVRFVDPAGL